MAAPGASEQKPAFYTGREFAKLWADLLLAFFQRQEFEGKKEQKQKTPVVKQKPVEANEPPSDKVGKILSATDETKDVAGEVFDFLEPASRTHLAAASTFLQKEYLKNQNAKSMELMKAILKDNDVQSDSEDLAEVAKLCAPILHAYMVRLTKLTPEENPGIIVITPQNPHLPPLRTTFAVDRNINNLLKYLPENPKLLMLLMPFRNNLEATQKALGDIFRPITELKDTHLKKALPYLTLENRKEILDSAAMSKEIELVHMLLVNGTPLPENKAFFNNLEADGKLKELIKMIVKSHLQPLADEKPVFHPSVWQYLKEKKSLVNDILNELNLIQIAEKDKFMASLIIQKSFFASLFRSEKKEDKVQPDPQVRFIPPDLWEAQGAALAEIKDQKEHGLVFVTRQNIAEIFEAKPKLATKMEPKSTP